MNATEKKVNEIIIRKLGIEDTDVLAPDTDMKQDLGADSLDEVEIIMELEQEFGIEVPDNAAAETHTVGDCCELVSKLLKEKEGV